ncbi:BUD32 protein kinase [Schizosaccharomyces japonicus yFS275]|uniref:non-specific serine/threonine protein kinase n=1 Tax=Schizosaccharomyces japonicus (strain yFS275 / FY16936) TaxID=402676 RepID=B6JVG7_SCHJY|nr:BUD32 protein kinase [Schizosaccharomyces japonicus yFS275]EEB05368.1 BUD32 protein kinase [Schizosaccharomyces japonicus yFS275]
MTEKQDLRETCKVLYSTSEEQNRVTVKQGAEAVVFRTSIFPGEPCLLKCRPAKHWRHPILDQRLTRRRCLAEARLLAKCQTLGLKCPLLYFVDPKRGEIYMEWIEGCSVRDYIRSIESSEEYEVLLRRLMNNIGKEVANLHKNDIIHGDLTTSNMMLRNKNQDDIVFIDFGLGTVIESEEDKAVDLYVLERALASTHPNSEQLFSLTLESYSKSWKASKSVLRRFEDVRMRGRKRSMVG